MTRKELIAIENLLNPNDNKDSLLIDKKGYFLYYNEPNKATKEIKVHTHNCGFCAWGSGRKTDKEVGKNGVWIGPFKDLQQAKNFAKEIIKPNRISNHSCV